jgi:hypothetical protein
VFNWLLTLVRRIWDWLRGWPLHPTITSIQADPTVVAPGGTSTITVRVRGGQVPYQYVVSTTHGRVQQISDGVFQWREE